jgi:predicted phosphoribosyltransferase
MARGGVSVAVEVAAVLRAELDVLVVRKIGHPIQPEYALGAVSEDGVALPLDLADELVEPQLERAREQARALRDGRRRAGVAGRDVVIVDDGLATGRSMVVALETVRRLGVAKLAIAVPVASGPAFRALAEDCEAYAVAIVEPPDFSAVGQFYDDFEQVSDDAVIEILRKARGEVG